MRWTDAETHMFPEEESQDGSSQFSQEDEEDEHEELSNDKKTSQSHVEYKLIEQHSKNNNVLH